MVGRIVFYLVALTLFCGTARAAPPESVVSGPEPPRDPLASPSWSVMARMFLADHPVRFDDRVRVEAPSAAEDAMVVPVHVSVEGLEGVEEILVFADLNPIQKILRYRPVRARPAIGFRFKVEQSTPIRAAARTRAGWHVGGRWLAAEGGGCTAPSVMSGQGKWYDELGRLSARRWPEPSGTRMKVRVMHPMDTGLAPRIPVFSLETLRFETPDGELLAELYPSEPISENPVFTLRLDTEGPIVVSGRDNQANLVAGLVPAETQP